MSTLYEIVELANGDIALQKEGETPKKANNGAPLVTMRFSTDLLRFLRGAKMDIAKVMIEAGLERVAHLAESVTREEMESKLDVATTATAKTTSVVTLGKTKNMVRPKTDVVDKGEQHPIVSHLLH